MAEPILITPRSRRSQRPRISPHARTELQPLGLHQQNVGKSEADLIAEQAPGIDVAISAASPDVSELPGAYKNAASMRRQIAKFGLAEVVDQIIRSATSCRRLAARRAMAKEAEPVVDAL